MHPDLEQPGTLGQLLRQLPDDAAQPYGWSEFQRRARQSVLRRRTRARNQALAVTGAIALGVVAVSVRLSDRPAAPAADVPRPGSPAEQAYATRVRTERLERWLASLPDEPVVVRVGTRAAVTGLEDRIAEVDDLLTAERIGPAHPARLSALQQERMRLVGALAQVRYAETLADASR